MPNVEERLRRRHAGRRVLLVEDNLINREVAEELLRTVGLVVEMAENGAVAVELCTTQEYDVVLMDLMMPVMDGIEAAKEIRTRRGDSLPIIAMTAKAFVQDRRESLGAGMNDHIAKPVDPEILYHTLLRWLPLHSSPVRDRWAASMASEFDSLQSDLEDRLRHVPGLDVDLGLRNVGGRLQTFAKVLARFEEVYRRGNPLLLGSSGIENRREWRVACHSLNGACAAVGALRLASLADAIDKEDIADRSDASLSESGLRLHTELVAFSSALMRALRG